MLFYFSLAAFLSLLVMCKQNCLLFDSKTHWKTSDISLSCFNHPLHSWPGQVFISETEKLYSSFNILRPSGGRNDIKWFRYRSEYQQRRLTSGLGWAWHTGSFGNHETGTGQVCATFLSVVTWNIDILFSVALIKLDSSDRIVYLLATALTHQVCLLDLVSLN